ncbi:hypothetical protein KSC_089340 [Ktedonobacter sp. SOSP1-52]|nr:hypothetical protein KSC_089340 [Ktedonobacter sp. SOSP1-52]
MTLISTNQFIPRQVPPTHLLERQEERLRYEHVKVNVVMHCSLTRWLPYLLEKNMWRG